MGDEKKNNQNSSFDWSKLNPAKAAVDWYQKDAAQADAELAKIGQGIKKNLPNVDRQLRGR